MGSDGGNIWDAEYHGREEPRQWNVYDPSGRYLGKVTTPARFAVAEIGEDYVLGGWRDEDDVDHIRMYRLESR